MGRSRRPWSASLGGIRGSACRPSAASARVQGLGDALGGVGRDRRPRGRRPSRGRRRRGGRPGSALTRICAGIADGLGGLAPAPPAGARPGLGAARTISRGAASISRARAVQGGAATGASGKRSRAASAILRARPGPARRSRCGARGRPRPGAGRACAAGAAISARARRPGASALASGRALALGAGLGARICSTSSAV